MSAGLMTAVLAIGAIAGGTSGFGFALITLTLLSFFINVKTAVAFLVIHSLTQNIVQLIHLRKHFKIKPLIPLLAGAVLGVPLGVSFLKSMDAVLVQKVLGLVVIIFVLQSVLKEKMQSDYQPVHINGWGTNSKSFTALIGITAGMLMGAFLSGGPPIVMYAVRAGGSKYQIKATMQSFFFFNNIYSLILYSVTGLMTVDVFLESASFLPVSIIGTISGIALFKMMSTPVFNRVLYVFLFLLGLLMLFK